jgi:uncharacterized metal-binding protein
VSNPTLIIPCSGIGKPLGTISREAAYCVVEDLKKAETDIVCLSLLVMGDDETRRKVKSQRCIVIDGCPSECAKKNLVLSGANLVANFRVVDLLRDHRDLKPKSVTFIDEDGRRLAKLLAEKVASKVDEVNQAKGSD